MLCYQRLLKSQEEVKEVVKVLETMGATNAEAVVIMQVAKKREEFLAKRILQRQALMN